MLLKTSINVKAVHRGIRLTTSREGNVEDVASTQVKRNEDGKVI